MYLFEYRQNPRLFWWTLAALAVVVVLLWPAGQPKCSDIPGDGWDYQTNTPMSCTK